MGIERIGLPWRCMPRAVDVVEEDTMDLIPRVRYIDIWLTANEDFTRGTVLRVSTLSGLVERITFRDEEGDERVTIRTPL